MNRKRRLQAVIVSVVLATATGIWAVIAQASAGEEGGKTIRGGGTSIITGGTGAPSYTPVTTKVAFNWSGQGQGRFDCLALAPSVAAGSPGSGNFNTNVMYVTGSITSAVVQGQTAVLKGSAVVTGLGAGSNRPFTLTVTRGGPGASIVLVVSDLTFRETLLEGAIDF